VGGLNAEGEEFECAQSLDQLEEVEVWVRNLVRRPGTSFWLQTATDRVLISSQALSRP
jgi:type III restriction enzyme